MATALRPNAGRVSVELRVALMVWIVLLTIGAALAAAFGAVAGALRARGRRAAVSVAVTLFVGCVVVGGIAYAAYLSQRHGALPPDHFVNSVIGNVFVVGGLLVSVGGLIGLAASYLILLRGDRG